MPAITAVANIAVAKLCDFTGTNFVLQKPSGVTITLWREAAKTNCIAVCLTGSTQLEVRGNMFLAGPMYVESSVDTQTIALTYW